MASYNNNNQQDVDPFAVDIHTSSSYDNNNNNIQQSHKPVQTSQYSIQHDINDDHHDDKQHLNHHIDPNSNFHQYKGGSVWSQSFLQKNKEHHSFFNSWSMNYLHHKQVPITTITIKKEDQSKVYPTNPFSEAYIPYWWQISAAFVMFSAFFSVQNMTISAIGDHGALALAVFYIFSTCLASFVPFVHKIFNGNVSFVMLLMSFLYLIFIAFAATGNIPLIYIMAMICGTGGAWYWPSHQLNILANARGIAESDFITDVKNRMHSRLEDRQRATLDSLGVGVDGQDGNAVFAKKQAENKQKVDGLVEQLLLPNGRLNMSKLTDEQKKRVINSSNKTVGYLASINQAAMMINQVVGGIVGLVVLNLLSDANTSLLFWVYAATVACANFLYFKTWKRSPKKLYAPADQPLQVDTKQDDAAIITGNNDNDVVDVEEKIATVTIQQIQDEKNQKVQDDKRQQELKQKHNIEFQQHEPDDVILTKEEYLGKHIDSFILPPLWQVANSLYMQWTVFCQRVMTIGCFSYFAVPFPSTFVLAVFSANAIKPTLGVESVPALLITFNLLGGIASLVASRILKTFDQSKMIALSGGVLQLIAVAMALFHGPQNWGSREEAWFMCFAVCIIAGIGEGLSIVGQVAGLGMILEGNGSIRASGMALYQTVRSSGQIAQFAMAKLVSFQLLNAVVVIIIALSTILQYVNYIKHVPIDQEYVLHQSDTFVWQKKVALLEERYENEYMRHKRHVQKMANRQ